MNHRKIPIVLALVLACTIFLSTAPLDAMYGRAAQSLREFRREYGEIADFFAIREFSKAERGTADTDEPSPASPPELSATIVTEVIPSPYNSADKEATVASLGGIIARERGEGVLDGAATRGYEAVPVFIDRGVSAIEAILDAHGVAHTTVSRKNTAPAGEVFAIGYAGLSDKNGYYINPNIAVVLYVSAPKAAKTAAAGNNLVYLTFDDGPSGANNEVLLDILDEYGIKAAFFTLGTAIEKNPDAAAAAVARGHRLGCHTMTHVYDEIYASTAALESEIESWEEAVRAAGVTLGYENKIFRFPGGSVSDRLTENKLASMKKMIGDRGYRIFDWNASVNDAVLYLAPDDVTPYDYIKQSFTDSLELALRQNEGKTDAPVIILMHETAAQTPELLTWIIESVIGRGLSFGNIDDLDSYTFSGK